VPLHRRPGHGDSQNPQNAHDYAGCDPHPQPNRTAPNPAPAQFAETHPKPSHLRGLWTAKVPFLRAPRRISSRLGVIAPGALHRRRAFVSFVPFVGQPGFVTTKDTKSTKGFVTLARTFACGQGAALSPRRLNPAPHYRHTEASVERPGFHEVKPRSAQRNLLPHKHLRPFSPIYKSAQLGARRAKKRRRPTFRRASARQHVVRRAQLGLTNAPQEDQICDLMAKS
jgi:hypothetical protein